jgi:hypothetical protein
MSAIQQMHDIEVGGGLAWPEEGKILVYLGCPLDPPPRTRMFGEVLVDSFAEAEAWLQERARVDYGVTFRPPKRGRRPIVQQLYEGDIPGSVYWIYDSAFAVALGSGEAGAGTWAEAKAWLVERSLPQSVRRR